MLTLTLPADDDLPAVDIHLEHSLASISKWEAYHEKAFFSKEPKTEEDTVTYVQAMLIDVSPPLNAVARISKKGFEIVNAYINSKQSATWFAEQSSGRGSSEVTTSELIYYWMIGFNIPFQPTETWHLNRLMTLIRICGVKQTKPKLMSKQAQAEQYRNLNAQRREQMGTQG